MMRAKTLAAALLAIVAVTQTGVADDEPVLRRVTPQANACFKTIADDPRLAHVNAKLAYGRPSPAQLKDKSVPTARDAEAIRVRSAAMKRCREMVLADVRKKQPSLAPSLEILFYQNDQVLDYLQQQAISYGTANALNHWALEALAARRRVYDSTRGPNRLVLAEQWRAQLQRGHSNPPPTPDRVCRWEGINIACE